jgi:outer membrane immunogenic protein
MSKTIQQEPIAAPFSWQGPYVGLHAGGTFGTAESMDLNFFDSPFPQGDAWNYDTSGFVGGAEAGYNWQRGHWVWVSGFWNFR